VYLCELASEIPSCCTFVVFKHFLFSMEWTIAYTALLLHSFSGFYRELLNFPSKILHNSWYDICSLVYTVMDSSLAKYGPECMWGHC